MFDQCVLPVLTYGAETLTLTKRSVSKIRVTQYAMGITIGDKIRITEIRRRTGVLDAVKRIATAKWNWAGHIARREDCRWTKKILEWRPRHEAYRSRRRPQTRWTDDIKRITTNWIQEARDRVRLREVYFEQWRKWAD